MGSKKLETGEIDKYFKDFFCKENKWNGLIHRRVIESKEDFVFHMYMRWKTLCSYINENYLVGKLFMQGRDTSMQGHWMKQMEKYNGKVAGLPLAGTWKIF